MSLDSLALVFLSPVRTGYANLLKLIMSKKIVKKANYINSKVTDVSKEELLEAIRKVQERNKLIDEKSKFTSQSLSVRAGQ